MLVSRRDFLKGSALALGAGSLSTFAMSQERKPMSAFDKEYFFILRPSNDDFPTLPSLLPDDDAIAKGVSYKVQPLGAKPFMFHNGKKDFQERHRVKPMSPPPDVMFDGSDIAVVTRIYEKLVDFEIPRLALQPAVYIDDYHDKWHENYWYLTFTELFDCWDREHSDYNPNMAPLSKTHDVYTYSLNDKILEETPLSGRRLFKMGGTADGFIVVHQSLADLFRVKGVDVVPILDYGVTYDG